MGAWLHSSIPALTDQQFAAWQELIETRTGIDFSQHRAILQGGLYRRLRELGGIDVEDYFAQVSRLPEALIEWQQLLDRIAVKETSFFRQAAAFDLVGNYLRKRVRSAQTLDVWSVGCATGEETYSLAMVASDVIERNGTRCFLGVLATDMCGEALQFARAGRYREKKLTQIPETLQRRYCVTDGAQGFRISPRLQQRICFAQANLLEAERLPALPMDVIFCQNVLVYFRRWLTKQVLDALVERLKPGGLLVLGPGEAAHWQHPAVERTEHAGVSAWLRRGASVVPTIGL
jgi:chemotaxis protein methyltransferase CheR/type IV pilus assembly protein PilK